MKSEDGIRHRVLGVDPAPKKQAMLWSEQGSERVSNDELREHLLEQAGASPALLVTWDSPLIFDPAHGFSDRPVDEIVRRWIREQVRAGRLEPKAVAVRPFCGCPHWAVSCHVLGLPYGNRLPGFKVVEASEWSDVRSPRVVAEVHPAVALALLWVDREPGERLPKYKGAGGEFRPAVACERIVERLRLAAGAEASGDDLDGYIAWWLGTELIRGRAEYFGFSGGGGYLLPKGASLDQLKAQLGAN